MKKRPTEIKIAAHYGLTTQTLRNYRNSDDIRMNERYSALREYYIKHTEKQDETSNTKS